MDGLSVTNLSLFVAGAFAAAFVTGLAGFAFAIVAAAAWLHFLPPTQATALIVAYGLIVQGVSVLKLRRAIVWPRLMPFLIGGALGVPLGIELLRWASPAALRIAVGAILVLFSLYSLVRPQLGSTACAHGMDDPFAGQQGLGRCRVGDQAERDGSGRRRDAIGQPVSIGRTVVPV